MIILEVLALISLEQCGEKVQSQKGPKGALVIMMVFYFIALAAGTYHSLLFFLHVFIMAYALHIIVKMLSKKSSRRGVHST